MMPDISKLKDHFRESKLYFNRTVAAIAFIFILFIVLLTRSIYLQIIKHDLYFTLAKNNQVRIIPTSPTRGLIYDRNGILLAENIPTFSLTIIPAQQKDLNHTIDELSKIIPISDEEKQQFLKQKSYKGIYEQIPIKNKLTEEGVAKFSLEKYRFIGVEIVADLTRQYKYKESISHAIGYLGPISDVDLKNLDVSKYRGIYHIGKTGVEKYYEDILRGEIGFKQVETNSRGMILRTLNEKPATAGKNLHLSIDVKLQQLVYNLMSDKQGAVIAIEPKTGEILAIVSSPGYDPNLFVQGISNDAYNKLMSDKNNPLFNRTIKGQYPPGSTVKPIIALAALDENIINNSYTIYDPGYYQINGEGRIFRDWMPYGHGRVNVEKALASSCTTFFYDISYKLGINKIYETFSKFNLGRKINVDIYGEAPGIAPSVEWKEKVKNKPWFPGETLNTGIGQGYTLATPLQIATISATIANRGVFVQPKIVKYLEKTHSGQTNIIPVEHKTEKIKLKNEKHWNTIITGMEKAVHSSRGTGYNTFKMHQHLPVAGKTGTAQVFSYKGQRYNKYKLEKHLRDHSWFMAFAPIDNPKIAIATILEHESGAASISRDIIEYYLMYNRN